MTSARDEIWIDMVQFDVCAADRLWEGIPPAHGAPEWYDDVSGLIETASGPAEPHELVDEPVVVEDMHKTTLDRPRRCRHGRTLGRVVAMKAAAATSVLGVAAAAAATTGIVATMASVVVPAIEEHVLLADDDDQEAAAPAAPRGRESGGAPDARPERQPNDLAAPPPAAPATPTSPQPADPEPGVASASPAAAAPTAETGAGPAPAVAEPTPPPDPGGVAPAPPPATEPAPDPEPPADGAPDDPVPPDPPPATDPAGTDPAPAVDPPTDPPRPEPIESASSGPEPAKPRVVERPAIDPPRRDAQPDKGRRWSDRSVDADTCARHTCPGPGHDHGGGKVGSRGAQAKAVAELVDHARRAHHRRG